MKPIYLILQNKKVFKGEAFGFTEDIEQNNIIGETVFTTAMTGYIETLTDPSYYGQIVVQSFPLIGNYGIIPADFESHNPVLKAYIVREYCENPSNFRCEKTLNTYLIENKIPGLCGIDTRELTKTIRESGVMNGMLTCQNPEQIPDDVFRTLQSHKITCAVEVVTTKGIACTIPPKAEHKVVLMDFGAKHNIARELVKRNCRVVSVPANSSAEEIINMKPDGIMLSNGPGDPSCNMSIVEEIKKLYAKKIPIFGICLGHQLLALANGAATEKLKYGHRGANQPVLHEPTGKVYITSQNHGYAVKTETLAKSAIQSFRNLNDNTCEGIQYTAAPAFSVQFHPEASAGPLDTSFLFDQFILMIKENPYAPQ